MALSRWALPYSCGWPCGAANQREKIWGEFLDATGIQQAVVYPTGGLAHGLIQDRDWSVALSRAYNSWLSETYLKADSRIKSLALLPVQDVAEAVQELRRGVEELGLSGGLLPAVTYNRKPYGHPDFLPIIQEAARLNVPLAVHAVTDALSLAITVDRADDLHEALNGWEARQRSVIDVTQRFAIMLVMASKFWPSNLLDLRTEMITDILRSETVERQMTAASRHSVRESAAAQV